MAIFSYKDEWDLSPSSIWPVSSNYKWNSWDTLTMEGFDKEEHCITIFRFKIMNSNCHFGSTLEMVRQTIIVALSICALENWNRATIQSCNNLAWVKYKVPEWTVVESLLKTFIRIDIGFGGVGFDNL